MKFCIIFFCLAVNKYSKLNACTSHQSLFKSIFLLNNRSTFTYALPIKSVFRLKTSCSHIVKLGSLTQIVRITLRLFFQTL